MRRRPDLDSLDRVFLGLAFVGLVLLALDIAYAAWSLPS